MSRSWRRPRRLIVADRDVKVHALMERVFRPPEFELAACATGRAALERARLLPPDCVVSDLVLPDMDAAGLLRALRAAGLESVPMLVATPTRSELNLRAVLDAGADGYLVKPFPLGELLGKVRALLRAPARRGRVEPLAPDPRASASEIDPAGAAAQPVEADAARPAAETQPPATVTAQGWGRYSRVMVDGRSLVVLTEATPLPRFVVTTVITENGAALRKIETELPHALAREEDRALVHQQIELQHENTLLRLDELVVGHRRCRIVWSRESIG